MKVLMCHNYYQQRGGEDQVFEDETWLLREHGHEVVNFELTNQAIDGLHRLDLVRKTLWNSEVEHELEKLIREFRPHVVHCINFFPLLSPAICHAAVNSGCAMVQVLQNYRLICPNAQLLRDDRVCEKCIGKTFAWPAIVHGCYRNNRLATSVVAAMLSYHRWHKTWDEFVDRFVVPSRVTRDKYIEAGFPAEKFSIKPNFVRPDPGIGQGSGDYAIFAGRLSPEKGVQTLLQAWNQIPGDWKLVIVGDGPLADQVRQAAESDTRIQWVGRQNLDQVCRWMGNARFSIMPSIWNEPFGRTVIESFAVGTPVLASRMGAMLELITENQTGRFFEPNNPDDLAQKAVEMFARTNSNERSLGNLMRTQARQEYLTKYTAEKNYGELISIYNQAINSRAQAT